MLKSMHDTYTMNNGNHIPCLAFGTSVSKKLNQPMKPMVTEAIKAGYRYFDSASLYESERAIGEAVIESGIPREDFFIATKIWWDEFDEPEEALNRSLKRLQMDYVDLYLVHWPMKDGDADWKERVLKVWRVMEDAVRDGRVKNIGLSNFLPHHLKFILDNCEIKPVVDQLELHPGYSQTCAKTYAKEQGVIPQAWSTLARGAYRDTEGRLNEYLESLPVKYGKSLAQIFIRYQIDNGVIPVIKSNDPVRMRENFDVFDFSLDQEDLWKLECMPQITWLGEHPDFNIPAKGCSREQ